MLVRYKAQNGGSVTRKPQTMISDVYHLLNTNMAGYWRLGLRPLTVWHHRHTSRNFHVTTYDSQLVNHKLMDWQFMVGPWLIERVSYSQRAIFNFILLKSFIYLDFSHLISVWSVLLQNFCKTLKRFLHGRDISRYIEEFKEFAEYF